MFMIIDVRNGTAVNASKSFKDMKEIVHKFLQDMREADGTFFLGATWDEKAANDVVASSLSYHVFEKGKDAALAHVAYRILELKL